MGEYEDKEIISQILNDGLRIKSILENKLRLPVDRIIKLIVDNDNLKIDFYDNDNVLYRFKSKGEGNVLIPDPETGGVKMTYDPALDTAITYICEEY